MGEGLGFAIPIDEALPIVEDLMKNGYVTGRPSLGISGTDITSAYSSYYGIPQGFLVKSVTKGSGSEKPGNGYRTLSEEAALKRLVFRRMISL